MGPGNRPLDLDWLEDFLALAESGNFSRAAQARAIAQPAFSRHIRGLEEWVGVELFDRSAHPARLTEAGQRFHPHVLELLAGLESARDGARAAHESAQATLSFAATHVLSLTYFSRWLAGIESRMTVGPIQTVSDSSQACEELMLQRRVQFVLCHGHADVPGRLDDGQFAMRVLDDDVLLPVCAPSSSGRPLHALDGKSAPKVLAYGEASGLGRILRARMRSLGMNAGASLSSPSQGPALDKVFTAHHAVLLRTLALDGRGLAWLPRSLVQDDLQRGSLVRAGSAAWELPVEIRLYRQPGTMANAAEALWALLPDR
ncbi:MAG: LysR family transcriptional regulator [Gammaproteobacteria bacterium]|nr:LysR family transcriptional regulator [Gammaproteobacteria bacterium]MBU2287123.1 LysR family transcriptional regulator [Gammaproteobacteria bacterium]MBU2410549.1 LysR family transcriptional regulator [Gammaproteobacteria bacterium]